MKDLWISFVNSVRTLMVASPSDRGLDQYLPLRDHVTEIVKDENFIKKLEEVFTNYLNEAERSNDPEYPLRVKIVDALKMELKAFPVAVEVNQTVSKLDEAPKA